MTDVRLNEGESFDSLIRRFSRRVQQSGIIADVRQRAFFLPPTAIRKRDAAIKHRKSQISTMRNS